MMIFLEVLSDQEFSVAHLHQHCCCCFGFKVGRCCCPLIPGQALWGLIGPMNSRGER